MSSRQQDLMGSAYRLPAAAYKALKSRPSQKFVKRTLAVSFDDNILGTGDRHALRIRNLSGRIFAGETFGNPAAGANFSKAIPTGETWEVSAISFRLTTDATAANRRVSLLIDDGSGRFAYVYSPNIDQAASLARDYTVSRGFPFEYTGFRNTTDFQGPLPDLGRLIAATRVRIVLSGGQAGDQLSNIFMTLRRHIDLRLSVGKDDYLTNFYTIPSDSEAYFGIHYGGLQAIAPAVARQLFHCEIDDEIHLVNPSAETTVNVEALEIA